MDNKELEKYDLTIVELVVAYRNTPDEKYLSMLLKQIEKLVWIVVKPYCESIPHAEIEDLISEGYMVLVNVINNYDQYRGVKFSTLLNRYITQHMNRLYKSETRKKRYNGSSAVSYESLVEINREGGSEGDSYFAVECEDFNTVEFLDFIRSLDLNEKEQVAVNVLMDGGTKGEVAKALKCTPATANYYFKKLRKKFILAGYII